MLECILYQSGLSPDVWSSGCLWLQLLAELTLRANAIARSLSKSRTTASVPVAVFRTDTSANDGNGRRALVRFVAKFGSRLLWVATGA